VELWFIMVWINVVFWLRGDHYMGWLFVVIDVVVVVVVSWIGVAVALVVGVVDLASSVVCVVVCHSERGIRHCRHLSR